MSHCSRRKLRPRRALTLGAIGVLLGGLACVILAVPVERLGAFFTLLGLKFSSAGNLIILAPVLYGDVPFSPFFLATKVTVIDSCVAFLVAAHLGLLLRSPWFGARLRAIEDVQRESLSRRPWLRRVAWIGLVLLVLLPVPASGAIGGTLLGRLLGLGFWRTALGVVVGTAAAAYGMAAGARALAPILIPLQDEAWFKITGAVVLGLLIAAFVARGVLSVRGNAAGGAGSSKGVGREPLASGGGP